jgi:hypothetical protein
MSPSAVAQLQPFSKLSAAVLADLRPESVTVFGCATGNGFEHIDPSIAERVVGVDANPAYLHVLRE